MNSRPILFKEEMIRTILEGRKTQTRRVIKPQPAPGEIGSFGQGMPFIRSDKKNILCPYGQPGDQLWIREKWRIGAWREDSGCFAIDYCDGPLREWRNDPTDRDGEGFNKLWIQCSDELHAKGIKPDDDGHYRWEVGQSPLRWRTSRYMPRWASRITLEITGVRVERLQHISDADAIAEGVEGHYIEDGWYWRNYLLTDEDAAISPMLNCPKESFRSLWQSINGADSWEANQWVWVIEFKRVKP